MPVPLLDVVAQHAPIQAELEAAALRVLRSGRYILGPEVDAFEAELATFTGAAAAVALSSGTDALLAVLMALEVGPGDEVVTTPFTFFATAGVVARLGARARFVDIEPDTFNLDPSRLDAAIDDKAKAILPVHLFGQCANLDAIEEIATRRGVPLVEDSCQSIGAAWNGRKDGTVGIAGCLSFFPSKNLGCAGDGGAVISRDADFAARVRRLRTHGQAEQYHHLEVGGNFRMDALQAAILRVKLKRLAVWEAGRRRNAERYRQLFAAAGLSVRVTLPVARAQAHHVYNQFVIRVPRRDELKAELSRRGIGNAVYYPIPLHLQPCFRTLGYSEGDFPVAEQACREVLAIPIYPELTEAQQQDVVGAITEFYA